MRFLDAPRRTVDRFLDSPASIRSAAWLITGATFVAVFVGSLIMRLFDRGEYPTFGRALWFTLQTVTTVGYGDATPRSALGRVVGAVVMLTAIAFITVITAAITSTFVEAARRRSARTTEVANAAAISHTDTELMAIKLRLDKIEETLSVMSRKLGSAESARPPKDN